jgi:DmsE family decaheme c-type cytochrome
VILAIPLLALAAVVSTRGDSTAEDRPRVSVVCLDCHDDPAKALHGTPHQILATDVDDPDARVACTDCHTGDENHYQDDPEEYPMSNPAKATIALATATCSGCHINSHQQNMQERNVHAENDVSCLGCHQIHGDGKAGLLHKEEFDLCLECHSDVRGEFAQPYRHPVSDGIVRCSECHMSLDKNKRTLSYSRIDSPCFGCHEYFRGPFPFEHQATLGFSTEEGGCLTCHKPHGSSLPRMLNRPYEPPSFNLCTQCHIVPLHNNNPQHGDEWAGVPCNDCHVDIHGSYVSQYFLTPALQSQGCFNVGCHQF